MLAETVEKWVEEWKQQGLQQGLQEGTSQEARRLFLILLQSRFGEIPEAIRAKIDQASAEEIERWTARIWQIESLTDAVAN
jgi:hypothetical protein